jgi:hypothetical protein
MHELAICHADAAAEFRHPYADFRHYFFHFRLPPLPPFSLAAIAPPALAPPFYAISDYLLSHCE